MIIESKKRHIFGRLRFGRRSRTIMETKQDTFVGDRGFKEDHLRLWRPNTIHFWATDAL